MRGGHGGRPNPPTATHTHTLASPSHSASSPHVVECGQTSGVEPRRHALAARALATSPPCTGGMHWRHARAARALATPPHARAACTGGTGASAPPHALHGVHGRPCMACMGGPALHKRPAATFTQVVAQQAKFFPHDPSPPSSLMVSLAQERDPSPRCPALPPTPALLPTPLLPLTSEMLGNVQPTHVRLTTPSSCQGAPSSNREAVRADAQSPPTLNGPWAWEDAIPVGETE